MSDADDRRELELLRLANAELVAEQKRQAARIEHLTRTNVRLVEQYDSQRIKTNVAVKMVANTTAKVVNAELETQIERLTAELEGLRARVADNTTPAAVLADVEELTNRDTAYDWMRIANAAGVNPQAERNVKPLRPAVPRQGGAS